MSLFKVLKRIYQQVIHIGNRRKSCHLATSDNIRLVNYDVRNMNSGEIMNAAVIGENPSIDTIKRLLITLLIKLLTYILTQL